MVTASSVHSRALAADVAFRRGVPNVSNRSNSTAGPATLQARSDAHARDRVFLSSHDRTAGATSLLARAGDHDRDSLQGVREQRFRGDGGGARAGMFPPLSGGTVFDRGGAHTSTDDRGAPRRRTPPGGVNSVHLLPAPPPIPSHLPGAATASSHGSASSRSVPPGRSNRPPTPSGPMYAARRDEAGAPARASVGAGHSLGREPHLRSAPEALQESIRSKSVASTGGSMRWSSSADGSHGHGSGGATSSSSISCDRCDGKHTTDRCPHFVKEREKHRDAWVNYGRKGGPHQMGSSGGNFVLKSARVVRQPGDGSCLFHSLNYGLNQGGLGSSSAQSLRREIASFLQQNPSLTIAGDTIEEWVRWDASSSVESYSRRMAMSGWGGGIEMAACSLLKNVNVHVYENAMRSCGGEFKRISCFDSPNAARTIHVLYQGGVHYDALVPLSA